MLPGQSFNDISNKKEELLRCENDSNRKTLLVNTVKFDINFLKRISCINDIKTFFFSNMGCEKLCQNHSMAKFSQI